GDAGCLPPRRDALFRPLAPIRRRARGPVAAMVRTRMSAIEIPGRPRRALLVMFTALVLGACSTNGGSGVSALGDDVVPGARDGNIRVVKDLPPPPQLAGGSAQPVSENDILEVDVFQ